MFTMMEYSWNQYRYRIGMISFVCHVNYIDVKREWVCAGRHRPAVWSVLAGHGQRYVVSTGGHDQSLFGPAVGRDVQLPIVALVVFILGEQVCRPAVDMRRPSFGCPQYYAVVVGRGLCAETFGDKRLEHPIEFTKLCPEVVVKPTVEERVGTGARHTCAGQRIESISKFQNQIVCSG